MKTSIVKDAEKKSGDGHPMVKPRQWPGIQLYYPPVKYLPAKERYETIDEAAVRLQNHACGSPADTILFDLEDGCHMKEPSRVLLARMLPEYREKIPGRIAVRINSFGTAEYSKDLALLSEIGKVIDDVILPKAGEKHSEAEVEILADYLEYIHPDIKIQPIVEHPLSLSIADKLMANRKVEHIIFGIHDFSKSMSIQLDPEKWTYQLHPFLCDLAVKARLAGCGVIGGVETLLPEKKFTMNLHDMSKQEIKEFLSTQDKNTLVVFQNALWEASMGLTGKQVIHPVHIEVCRHAFFESESEMQKNREIIEIADAADAWQGGAVRHDNQMIDPPMFIKALQRAFRNVMLCGVGESELSDFTKIFQKLPKEVSKEVWPYKSKPDFLKNQGDKK